LFETRDGLIGSIEYATDLFERPTMETLAADLRAILAAAAADPSARLSRLAVAGPPERPTPAIPTTPTTPATPAAPAGRLSQLSREARALLFERLQRQRAARAEGRIPRRPRTGEPFPLSFSQERLWFIHRLQPGTGAYNVPVALEIRGPLVPQGLEAALGEVVRRHESLRTVFADHDGRSVQVILPELRPPLPQIDLGDVPAGLREREVRRIAEEEAIRPFDLERGPLLRALMVRREPERHALVLVVHHIVSDGWSQGLLVQELVAAYGAALDGRPSPLPELPIQYPDFAAWQRERLAGGALEEQLAYWRERLDGAPRFLELPTDRPRPPIQTFGGRDLPFQVPESTLRGLQAVARGREATLFMVLLAAFQALLSRLTGQRDLVVGTPIANRTRDELAPLIGFFVNTLALRIDLSGDPTFEELLGRVRRGALDSYAHQDFPFERLVEALRPERHLSHTPLFQVMFALQNAPSARAEVAGIAVAPVEFMIRSAIFDLELSFAEGDGGLGGSFRYNCDLFDRATILRFIGHLQELLAAVARDGGLRLAALPLLTTAQRHQLLEEWNDTGAGPAADVLAPFDEQAAARPGAEALSAGDRRVTYGELDRWANRLAHRLRALGVGPDTVVGLLADRSVELAVGLLGILKAGGAYLPLDPGLPAARLAFLLEDSGAPFAVAPERLAGQLPAFGGRLLLLDTETEGGREERPEPVAGPDDLACVTYASETGGRPKAVLVERGSLASRLAAARRRFGFGHSFDTLVFELLSPLDVPCLAGELRSAIHDS
jgi:non-ribosomal peptide synthetase component F